MGLLARIRGKESRGADPLAPWGNSTPPTNGMLASPTAGVYVTEGTALGIAAVWSCTTLLADTVATNPLRQFSVSGQNLKEVTRPSPLIAQPHAETTLYDWLVQAMMSRTLRGNVFGRIVERDANLYATQVMLVHPDKTIVRRNSQSNEIEYRMNGELVPLDDVVHICGPRMPGSLIGMNPIEVLRTSFGLARAADLYGASFFANSAMPSGILKTDQELTPQQTLDLRDAWIQAHQGVGLANLPAVLQGGVSWETISITPDDAQFIQSRGFSRGEVAMIYRVPPHMIGDVDRTTSWGTGIEQQELGFVRNTLAGYLRPIENAFSALLPPGQVARFDLSERLRGDTLQRYQGYTLGINGGFLSSNDVRRKEGLPEIGPEGDVYRVPMNIMDLKDLAGAGLMPVGTSNPPSPNPQAPSDVAPPGKAEQKARPVLVRDAEEVA